MSLDAFQTLGASKCLVDDHEENARNCQTSSDHQLDAPFIFRYLEDIVKAARALSQLSPSGRHGSGSNNGMFHA
jgi:hypothetical protein